jgi:hypothetical protein
LKIERRKVASFQSYPGNPRIKVDAVAASAREFRFRQPIVVDSDGMIICNRTRGKREMSSQANQRDRGAERRGRKERETT